MEFQNKRSRWDKSFILQAKALVEQRAAELENAKIDLNRCEIKSTN